MKFPTMLEDESLEEYFKKIKKVCINMHDKKHNLKKFNNKKTVAFVSFAVAQAHAKIKKFTPTHSTRKGHAILIHTKHR